MDIQTIQTLEIDRDAIAAKLVELREVKKMSQTEVGNLIGFNRRQIWQFENGKSLTLENIVKLAAFYEKPLEFFIGK